MKDLTLETAAEAMADNRRDLRHTQSKHFRSISPKAALRRECRKAVARAKNKPVTLAGRPR